VSVEGLGTGRHIRVFIVAEVRALEPRPDFVLVDVSDRDGLLGIRRLLRALPGLCVVALTVPETEDSVVACAEAGAVAYVTRHACTEEVVATIVRAARGEAMCSPTMTAALLRRISTLANGSNGGRRAAALTARELEIAELIERGLSNKEIGARLQIELPTVKNHVHRILGKLGVDGRAEAAAWVRAASASMVRGGADS
jgi:DNA-binding NarL/FixJ family response regulator